MDLPFVCLSGLTDNLLENWQVRFAASNGYDRAIRENVWRRHQDPKNRELSGWKSPDDARRRVVHFRDYYSVVDRTFVLANPYLFFHLKLPQCELRPYVDRFLENLPAGSWRESRRSARDGQQEFAFERGGLACELKTYARCEFDRGERLAQLGSYGYLDVTLRAKAVPVPEDVAKRPWVALRAGIRRHAARGNPREVEAASVKDWLPAQVELGCGPSIEAGVPALNTLHRIYSITTREGRFVMGSAEDRLPELFRDPENSYRQIAAIHVACLKAQTTSFYRALKRLADDGRVVGPILTNNFDGLALSAGLEELPLRQYDRTYEYPRIRFHPRARSLVVIGSHADRRNAQASARQQGLKIIHVDPEGYRTDDGFVPYPLESPQDDEILVRAGATEFLAKLGVV